MIIRRVFVLQIKSLHIYRYVNY